MEEENILKEVTFNSNGKQRITTEWCHIVCC